MSLELWIGFAAAAMVVLVVPGPTLILVTTQAIAHGRRAVPPLVAGVVLGDFSAMTLSLAGLGAVLAASAALFGILKFIGAFYLVYLGLRLWRKDPQVNQPGKGQGTPKRSFFKSAFIVTASNPKGIAFFVAFLPQFIDPGSETIPQLLLLGATFLGLAAVNAAVYGFFAGRLRDLLQNATTRRWFNRTGATALIGAGIVTATVRRTL